ncbi:hypothetical protein DSM107003_39720 [Trichormus variabilis SAG 1403-4b]|uniref:Uncharacterized protein n=1 Tax=Trichormus variabilis SAG 1403-4b TaxID=447716 RepID=A0A433UJR4_ANAVA|nr:hypothetical protein DSM107003_39720 [Trichormus variabilis SAG 1403-4b]
MINNIGLVEGKVTPLGKMTLEEFFSLPYIEELPAWEYIININFRIININNSF